MLAVLSQVYRFCTLIWVLVLYFLRSVIALQVSYNYLYSQKQFRTVTAITALTTGHWLTTGSRGGHDRLTKGTHDRLTTGDQVKVV
jgi:hypothetical protein